MHRGRLSKDSFGGPSNIPKRSIPARRSSSAEIVRRGSYLPSKPRTSSAERFKTPCRAGSKASPRVSGPCGPFQPQRGSFVDRKRSVIKDARPLSDKAYQRQCVTELVQFLEDNGFPYIINPNNLMNPQKKDYEMIFQFLFNMLDSKYEIRRIEEEVPKIMKSLNYPFTLAKSSFLSITRMSWPSLLGTLMWLLKLNMCAKAVTVEDYIVDDSIEQSIQVILLNCILHSYASGIEDFEKEDELFSSLLKQQDKAGLSMEEMTAEIQQIQIAIDKEKKDQEEFDCRVKCNKGIENDIKNYEEFISKMNSHLQQREINLEEVKIALEEKEKELKVVKEAVLEKEKQYKAQGYDGQKAHNLYVINKKNLESKLDEVKGTFKQEESTSWDLEIELCRSRHEIEAICQQFNIAWQDLNNATENALYPVSSVKLPVAWKLLEQHKSAIPDFLVRPRSKEEVSPTLSKLKKHIAEMKEKLQGIMVIQKQHLSELEMKLSSAAMKKRTVSTLSDQMKRDLELKNAESKKLIESIEKEISDLEEKVKNILNNEQKSGWSKEEYEKQIAQQKKENVKKLSEWKIVIDTDDQYMKEGKQALKETIGEIQAERMKTHHIMQEVLKEL